MYTKLSDFSGETQSIWRLLVCRKKYLWVILKNASLHFWAQSTMCDVSILHWLYIHLKWLVHIAHSRQHTHTVHAFNTFYVNWLTTYRQWITTNQWNEMKWCASGHLFIFYTNSFCTCTHGMCSLWRYGCETIRKYASYQKQAELLWCTYSHRATYKTTVLIIALWMFRNRTDPMIAFVIFSGIWKCRRLINDRYFKINWNDAFWPEHRQLIIVFLPL